MDTTLETLLESISKRPGMYLHTISLENVSIYLSGYCHGQIDAGKTDPLSGWRHWVEMRFCISHPAWHWTRILLHNYGSDQVCIDLLPELYLEFKKNQKQMKAHGVEDERKRRLIAEYGKEIGFPLKTNTSNPM